MGFGSLTVNCCKVIGVEKGNADKVSIAGKRVCALTLDVNSQHVKVLLKGEVAKVVYDKFLKEGRTKEANIVFDDLVINKQVYVSFSDANIREVRDNKDIIVDNPEDLQFTFDYLVI